MERDEGHVINNTQTGPPQQVAMPANQAGPSHLSNGPPGLLPPLKHKAYLSKKSLSIHTINDEDRVWLSKVAPIELFKGQANEVTKNINSYYSQELETKGKGKHSKHRKSRRKSESEKNSEEKIGRMDRYGKDYGQTEQGSAFPVSAGPHVGEGPASSQDTWASSPESHVKSKPTASAKPPLAFCKFIAENPGKAFALSLSCHLGMLALTFILKVSGYDILPMEFTAVPLDLTDDVDFLRGEAWVNRKQDPDIISRLGSATNTLERSMIHEPVELYYSLENEDGNVFLPENLRAIMEAEKEIMQIDGMKDFCHSPTGSSCAPLVSIINFFDGNYRQFSSVFYDPDFEEVSSVLSEADSNSLTKTGAQFHFGKDSLLNNTQNIATSSITRSLLIFGLPLNGYSSIDDRKEEQEEKLKTFFVDHLRPKLYKFASEGINGMDFFFNGLTLYTEDVNAQVIKDLSLAVGSFGFIFFFMWFQVRSLFITAFGLLSIITSFCGANMLYRIAFDYRFFGIFHVLSIFIILGIGADDIFVFYDTWRLSDEETHPSLAHRLSFTFRKAASAMFVTSLTTMIAFFASALSPLLAVNSFGLFSGLLVFTNYLSVITYFPTVVTFYHVKFKAWKWPCCLPCSQKSVSPSTYEKGLQKADETIVKQNPVVHFFQGQFFSVITHKWIRWVIIAAFLILLGIFLYFATSLKPDEEFVRIFKDDHNYGKANLKRVKSFRPSVADRIIRVNLVWGLKPQDRSNCHKTDFTDSQCQGHTVWDPAFDLNPAPAQKALLDFCETLRNLSPEEGERLKIRRDPVTNQYEVKCFIENLQRYYQVESNKSLPLLQTKMQKYMSTHPSIYNMASIGDTYYRYFEVAMGHWLTHGYSRKLTHDFESFVDLLGESLDPWDNRSVKDTGIFYGTRLRYMAVSVNTSLPYGNIGYQNGVSVAHAWEDFFTSQVAKMPPSLSGGFQCTPELRNSWHWLKVQKALVDSAWSGVIIGISLSFPILVVATQNLVLGFLATLTIMCITCTVIGVIPLAGWKLGVLESLNLSLVVGLAVDYVVHLAEGYHSSSEKLRLGRTHDMLKNVGISVISGATTTLGASLFMLFAQILFFMQFGIFMFCTIGFSLLYSLGLFTTVLGLMGPQNETGSIKPLWRLLSRLFKGRKPADVDCRQCEGRGFHEDKTQSEQK